MSLNDPRWGRSPGHKPEDGSRAPSEGERPQEVAPGGDGREPDVRPDNSSQAPEPTGKGDTPREPDSGSRTPQPAEKGDAPKEPDDSRESRESAKNLEAEWQSFNEMLRMFMRGGAAPKPGSPEGNDRAPEPRRDGGRHLRRLGPRAGLLAVVACLFAVGVYLGAGFYSVPAGHSGALYSLGKFSRVVGAGTHWHLPWPFEKVRLIDTRLVHRTDVNFTGAGRGSYLLTADGCLAELRASLQWKVKTDGVRSYLEQTDNPSLALESAFRRSLRQEFSFLTAHDVVAGRALRAKKKIAGFVQAEADRLGLGIEVVEADITHAGLAATAARSENRGADDGLFATAQARAALTDRIAVNTARRIRENAASYEKRVTHIAKTDAEFIRFLYSRQASDQEKRESLERAWNAAMEAALPNQGELSNASAVEIMNVIRRRRAGDDGGLRKVSDGAVTMDDILALRRSESVERKAAGDSGAQQGGELGTRDTTTDRREYLRRRGR